MAGQVFDRPFALSMGPQRSGARWLETYLKARGDICLPEGVKETFFFDRHYDRGLDFYAGHFKPAPQHALMMEITTTVFDHDEAPKRVFELFGQDVTLICPLRSPVTRSYALFRHYKRYGIERGSLREVCFKNPQILESSKYAKNLKRWYAYFDPSKISVLYQEDLQKDPVFYTQSLCQALNIPHMPPGVIANDDYPFSSPRSEGGLWERLMRPMTGWLGKRNVADENLIIPESDRLWLQEQLSDETEELQKMMGPIAQWTR